MMYSIEVGTDSWGTPDKTSLTAESPEPSQIDKKVSSYVWKEGPSARLSNAPCWNTPVSYYLCYSGVAL